MEDQREEQNDVLLKYAQRFAKSSDETINVEEFDSRPFKWNVCGILDDEPAKPEPGSRVPSFYFHKTIPGAAPTTPAMRTQTPHIIAPDEDRENLVAKKQINCASFPKRSLENFGQAPKLTSGQMPSSSRCTGARKNLALRVPLPGAPPNQAILSKSGKGAQCNAKGLSKGRPQVLDKSGKTSFWDEFCAMHGQSGKAFGGDGSNCEPFLPMAFDLDGPAPKKCSCCRLPLGDQCYFEDGKGFVHGECMAQLLLQGLRDDEDQRNQKDEDEKRERRLEYDIGWKANRIPRNIRLQCRLKDMPISHGMTCLVLNAESRSVRLAPTCEPSAAVNLEYLSIALQVRRKDGREPLFSLDPVNPQSVDAGTDSLKHETQMKRFEPAWLAGTSAGDVLFEADYHLKELSMGEYEQPVVGMKSCFDYSEEEDMAQKWSAREWFLVRKAEVHLSEDGVLLPMVKMAVEAREQVYKNGALLDAPITRTNHPMVRYAEAFTKNFDLIAERKSVVYHLRELAKASVLAKFLIDSNMEVEESWFNLAGDVEEACALEIPQLWNERVHSRIRVKDGEILDKRLSQMHGIYGGVQFGLDRFRVDQLQPRKAMPGMAPPSASVTFPSSLARRGMLAGGVLARGGIPTSVASAPIGSLQGMSTRPSMAANLHAPGRVLPPPPEARMAAGLSSLPMPMLPRLAQPMALTFDSLGPSSDLSRVPLPSGVGAGLSANGFPAGSMAYLPQPQGPPRGVDLNLNQFSLDTVEQMSEGNWVSELQSAEAVTAVADAFWSCIDGTKASPFEKDDLALLKSVFNPNLSDRRVDGDAFAPPDTSIAAINKLRSLVKEEEEVRQARKDHFFSASFKFESPGQLFPASWAPFVSVAGASVSEHALSTGFSFVARTDYTEEANAVLKSASAAFHKKTEDGVRFRIYRVGSLEVRTTQEHNGEENVGAVFSVRTKAVTKEPSATGARWATRCTGGREQVKRITEYVQIVHGQVGAASTKSSMDYSYYLVLETVGGSTILTEQLADGAVTWEENLSDLEDRNSLAKVIRSASCQAGMTVQDLRLHRVQVSQECRWSCARGQNYATSAFTVALGGLQGVIQAAQNRDRDIKLREAAEKQQD